MKFLLIIQEITFSQPQNSGYSLPLSPDSECWRKMSIIDYGMKKKFPRPSLTNADPKVVDYIIYLENIISKLEAENYKLQSQYSPEKIKASLNKKNM